MSEPRPTLPSLGLSPLSPVSSRADLVAESIRSAILAGRIRPGDTLVERRLAAELGVSKTPVREALIMLAAGGLVVLTPTRGTSVRVLDADDLRKIQEVRLLLEPWAVGRHGPARPARLTWPRRGRRWPGRRPISTPSTTAS